MISIQFVCWHDVKLVIVGVHHSQQHTYMYMYMALFQYRKYSKLTYTCMYCNNVYCVSILHTCTCMTKYTCIVKLMSCTHN